MPIRKQLAAGQALFAALLVVGTSGCSSTSSPSSTSATPSAGLPSPSSPTHSPAASTSATALSACTPDQLDIKLEPLRGAATGKTFMDIVLTDKSASACTVTGSVDLAVTDAAHQPIAVPISHFPGGGATPVTFTVRPGASAAQTLAYSSDGNPAPGQTVCAPPIAFFDITVPGAKTAVPVPVAGRNFCPRDSITISALIPGGYSPPF
jgi:hypothetical protein